MEGIKLRSRNATNGENGLAKNHQSNGKKSNEMSRGTCHVHCKVVNSTKFLLLCAFLDMELTLTNEHQKFFPKMTQLQSNRDMKEIITKMKKIMIVKIKM